MTTHSATTLLDQMTPDHRAEFDAVIQDAHEMSAADLAEQNPVLVTRLIKVFEAQKADGE